MFGVQHWKLLLAIFFYHCEFIKYKGDYGDTTIRKRTVLYLTQQLAPFNLGLLGGDPRSWHQNIKNN